MGPPEGAKEEESSQTYYVIKVIRDFSNSLEIKSLIRYRQHKKKKNYNVKVMN